MAGSDKDVYCRSVDRFDNHDEFVSYVETMARRVHDVSNVKMQGIIGQTGVTIWDENQSQLLGGVWHPKYVGGIQGSKHIEAFRGRVIGWQEAVSTARSVVKAVRLGGFREAANRYRAFIVGYENEVHMHDRCTCLPFELPKEGQQELQVSLDETDVGHAVSLEEQARLLAVDVVQRSERFPDAYATMTGMMIGGTPADIQLNNGVYQEYVRVMSERLLPDFYPRDAVCEYAWNHFSAFHGYRDFLYLKDTIGHIGIMTFAASHINVSVAQFTVNGRWFVPLELSTAVATMMNSQMSLVMKWMMYSGNMVQGVRIKRIGADGQIEYAKSARDVMRRAIKTTDPAHSPEDADAYLQVVAKAIEQGYADRIARAGMIVKGPRGEVYSVPHGHLRHRNDAGTFAEPNYQASGRLELVSGDSTDILPRLSAAAFCQLLQLGAYEAVADGSLPEKYWRLLPSLVTDENQLGLSDAYNFSGLKESDVKEVVSQAFAFVRYIKTRYSADDVQAACNMANYGLGRLVSGEGNMTEQVVCAGNRPEDIIRLVHDAQLAQARTILDYNGDVLKMVSARRIKR